MSEVDALAAELPALDAHLEKLGVTFESFVEGMRANPELTWEAYRCLHAIVTSGGVRVGRSRPPKDPAVTLAALSTASRRSLELAAEQPSFEGRRLPVTDVALALARKGHTAPHVAEVFNLAGVKAPRGGLWTAQQVRRLWKVKAR